MYDVLRYACATTSTGINIDPVVLSPVDNLIVVSYGDCGWANADEYGGQTGYVLMLTTAAALTGPASAKILSWRSAGANLVVRHAPRTTPPIFATMLLLFFPNS